MRRAAAGTWERGIAARGRHRSRGDYRARLREAAELLGRTYAATRARASRIGAQSYTRRDTSARGHIEVALSHFAEAVGSLQEIDVVEGVSQATVDACIDSINAARSRLEALRRDLTE